MAAVINKCNCTSEFQDKEYGKGNRVINLKDQKSHQGKGKCTICGKEHSNLR